VVNATPGNDPVPYVQQVRWAEVPVWTGEEISPYRDSMPGPLIPQRVAIPATVHEIKVKVNQDRPRWFQEVKVPRFRDNGTGWW